MPIYGVVLASSAPYVDLLRPSTARDRKLRTGFQFLPALEILSLRILCNSSLLYFSGHVSLLVDSDFSARCIRSWHTALDMMGSSPGRVTFSSLNFLRYIVVISVVYSLRHTTTLRESQNKKCRPTNRSQLCSHIITWEIALFVCLFVSVTGVRMTNRNRNICIRSPFTSSRFPIDCRERRLSTHRNCILASIIFSHADNASFCNLKQYTHKDIDDIHSVR